GLHDYNSFGKQLKGYTSVRKQADAVVQGIDGPLGRIVAIYDFVRNAIVWDGTNRIMTHEDLDDILEAKQGNSADINLLLTLMLDEIGIKANPVLLSTRRNGRIQKQYPITDQFDYVIARAEVGDMEYLLDATDRLRPYYLLPLRALNHLGLSVEKHSYAWITIAPTGRAATSMTATV